MNIEDLDIRYNSFVDVLFINIVNSTLFKAIEIEHKIILRYRSTGSLIGIIFIDFRELDFNILCNLLDIFLYELKISKKEVLDIIDNIT